ncbi:IS110 family transposase [Anaerobacillus alkaliphilus]|uniref:IS110 family transposase n=1 Tax=Anaerobacillus alkaliphilus TaxID=1548597 RepID=A0A4Q0VWU1_9BACI|nr:IS110 family transposase [Anaerobacillus alkaliphilus]RXJ02798.1 IS110 family transposase [Anaerobacillus alkaliphilus]RXJ03822.1 IS110 family transposase [Anaerobacillus alkaliphilus]
MKHVLAFDVSMGKSTMVIYNHYKKCEFEGEINHNKLSFKALNEKICEITKLDGQAPEIVFEASGVYSRPLEYFFQTEGYPYHRVSPLEANLQTASMRRHKTDKSDAHELAKSHFRTERTTTYQEENYYKQMRALTRYYDELESESTNLFSRMHAILQLSFPELEHLFSKRSALFLNIVQLYPHPDEVLECSKTVIRNRLKANTKKNLSLTRAEEKGIGLLHAAQNSYPAISKEDVRCEQVRDYAKRISDLKEKKEQIIKQMAELSKGRIEFQVLTSFPGIGEVTAVRLIGEIGDLRRFQNHKQLNAYVGIDIMRYQSGNTFYKDKINKRGNNKLRKILYFMIQTMIKLRKKTNNHIIEYYDKLKTQPHGKPHKVASIACVNKFLKVAFHLITHNITYDYEAASTCS